MRWWFESQVVSDGQQVMNFTSHMDIHHRHLSLWHSLWNQPLTASRDCKEHKWLTFTSSHVQNGVFLVPKFPSKYSCECMVIKNNKDPTPVPLVYHNLTNAVHLTVALLSDAVTSQLHTQPVTIVTRHTLSLRT